MEILVCIKRVPDPAENEISLAPDGDDIERDDLVYSVNEWDNYAVEEAVRIVEEEGGTVTVVSVDSDEGEDIIYREMAMGAEEGRLLSDAAFEGSDGLGTARILAAAAQKGSYDLILTGAQADDGAAQVGGMLAALLDWPYASVVNLIDTNGAGTLRIGREIEGGNQEVSEIETPCVLSIQTGINEPRYVGVRGIRKVASYEIPVLDADALGLAADSVGAEGANVRRVDYFIPERGAGAEMIEGSIEEIADKLVDLLKAQGGIR
ncbi:MAG: electron transfer flavoprotein subunit beta/FixA family protein [Longimicrobiales bacterium]